MGWSNWSYWLRGGLISTAIGLIGLGIGLVFRQFSFILLENSLSSLVFLLPAIPFLAVYFILALLFEPARFSQQSNFLFNYVPGGLPAYRLNALGITIAVVGHLITYFIIGAIIGLIIGKIKSRKQNEVMK